MKNYVIGSLIAASIFAAPMYPVYAQTATTTEDQIQSLRAELINILLQLVASLQAQLDAQLAHDVEQDEEITTIKTRSGSSSSHEEPAEEEEQKDDLAEVRERVGTVAATASLQEDDGEVFVAFSVFNYLDVDTVSYEGNLSATSTEDGGCSAISNTDYKTCAQHTRFQAPTDTDLIITVTVNGQEERMRIQPGQTSVARVTWPQI